MNELPVLKGDPRDRATVPASVWIQHGPKGYLRYLPHYVYRHFDSHGNTLYVGCSYDPRARFSQQKMYSTYWTSQVAHTEYTDHSNMAEAREVEYAEMGRLEPFHNTQIPAMDTDEWSKTKFIRHGRQLALGQLTNYVTGLHGIGRLAKRYEDKFDRNLFDDMGMVPKGYRSIDPEEDLSPRLLYWDHEPAPLPPLLQAV